jgi:hypothetical protein
VNNKNYGTSHYAKAPNIQFFFGTFSIYGSIGSPNENRNQKHDKIEGLKFPRIIYIAHNLPHVRIGVENDVLHL